MLPSIVGDSNVGCPALLYTLLRSIVLKSMMEEADLLKERLQAITDKRRVQEDIARKRGQIEEEKLKLQYIKKKTLREQWLMDGVSPQSREEEEASRLQAQDEQQQSQRLQTHIDRMEKEMEALEAEELNISTKEDFVLKRLKEVERTAQDIIRKAISEKQESDEQELQGFSSTEKNRFDHVTMETTDLPELEMGSEEDVTAPDSPEKDIIFNVDSEEVCIDTDSPDFNDQPSSGKLSTSPGCPETSVCHDLDFNEEQEVVTLEEGHIELQRNESMASSVSDTLSSAESVYENEASCKRQETTKQEPEHDLEPYSEPKDDPNPESLHETEEEVEQDTDLDHYPDPLLFPDEEYEPHLCDDDFQNLEVDAEEDPEILCESPLPEESTLAQSAEEEVLSQSCDYLDPDEVDECLSVEIAATSSNSEANEKWRTIFSSSINKEDDDSYLDSLQLSAQELFVQKVEVIDFEDEETNHYDEVQFPVPQVEEVLEQPDSALLSTSPQEGKCISLGPQVLFKISEDENENGKEDSNRCSAQGQNSMPDPNRKLPKDFCVIQETKSVNVSTEHVDFQLARQQWRAMEEQTKNKVVLPTTKQTSFHCSHNCMYTPVRNIERTKRTSQELENLTLVGDYSQYSPCSEDSGLDDSSYRSPNDDLETPVEKEIRLSMEREENFRKERSLSRMGKSTDTLISTPMRGIPRSISTPLTPSFIITSSPTKEPMKQDASPTNIIILDQSSDVNSSPGCGEWCCEDSSSNVIILETSNLIIRSASDFSLNKACEPLEKMFTSNPFFKLRSRSTMSLVDEEIMIVKQREEELRKERANLYSKGRMLANNLATLSLDFPVKCKSSPSSPMKTAKMDRSTLSCDHRFLDGFSGGRRKSAMALRWEAGEFTKND
ncbi:palmdelphin isoform X1 [Entelurus aequoreus]|uniref:palmdelphin isoform X1 n=2 Tax=Entelurus aequoreus TaxID=161455 RepID=UPI002B1DFEAC|nr:palmdelphin isoform X1 [Entelurus aequoreus]